MHTQLKLLAKNAPNDNSPIKLYISSTKSLAKISYVAEIVNWEEKQKIPQERIEQLNEFIKEYQSGEKKIYMTANGKKCVNLISVKNMQKLKKTFSVSNLVKISNGEVLSSNRTRAGGWSPVVKIPEASYHLPLVNRDIFEKQQEKSIKKSKSSSEESRLKRLLTASEIPEKVQLISTGYRRNSDVVVEVLIRANGKCERCKSDAPFVREKDDTPYLEIHHWTPLSEGGKDTVDNAGALCPNCHRELHYGKNRRTKRSS